MPIRVQSKDLFQTQQIPRDHPALPPLSAVAPANWVVVVATDSLLALYRSESSYGFRPWGSEGYFAFK